MLVAFLPPLSSIIFLYSSRECCSNVPLITIVMPVSRVDAISFSSMHICTPASLNRLIRVMLRSSRKNVRTLDAITSPTPSHASRSSILALNRASIDLKWRAIPLATTLPTKRIPRANKTRSNGTFLLSSIPSIILLAERAFVPSSPQRSCTLSWYKSATS